MSVLELSGVKTFPIPDRSSQESYISSIYEKKPFNPVDDYSQKSTKHIPISTDDLSLSIALNSLGKLKVLPVETKSFSTTSTLDADIEGTKRSFQKVLLSTITMYQSNYKGKVSDESTHGCHLIASQIGDRYNPKKKRFQRRQYLENDYLGILAKEEKKGNTLIAFDNAWVLAGISEYIDLEAGYGVIRTQALREDLARLHPVLSGDIPIARWRNHPQLIDKPISKQSLQIYVLNDLSFTPRDSKVLMIFAPVSADEAERIYIYLYRNIKMYSFYSYLVVKDLSLSAAKDFQYLFPVELDFVGNYIILKSKQMSQHSLEHAFELNELSFPFPRIDNLVGCYAAYLLAEATWYSYEIRWENRTLYIKNCGYVQARELSEYFAQFLTNIYKEKVQFQKVPNFATATKVAEMTGSKCFYYLGNYYVAAPERMIIEKSSDFQLNPREIEMTDPLRAVHFKDLRSFTLEYLILLGYDVMDNPEPYSNDIQLGYRTFKVDDNVFTVYYYITTHGEEIDLHEIDGKHIPKIQEMLEKLLHQGFFFTSKIKNLTTGYPGFVPGLTPIKRLLPKEPKRLIKALSNLLQI